MLIISENRSFIYTINKYSLSFFRLDHDMASEVVFTFVIHSISLTGTFLDNVINRYYSYNDNNNNKKN